MEHKTYTIQEIETYLDGSMPKTDLVSFEKQLKTDSTLKEEVVNQKLTILAIQRFAAKQMKTKLNALDQENPYEKRGWSTFLSLDNLQRLSAAAALLTVALFFVFGIFTNNPDDLFDQYYEPYPNIVAPVFRSDGDYTEKEEAMMLYEQGKYKQAIMAFTQVIAEEENPSVFYFYNGLSYLSLGNSEKAIYNLQQVEGSCQLAEQTEWYLALAYLQANDLENTQSFLDDILQDGAFYKENAKSLKHDLD